MFKRGQSHLQPQIPASITPPAVKWTLLKIEQFWTLRSFLILLPRLTLTSISSIIIAYSDSDSDIPHLMHSSGIVLDKCQIPQEVMVILTLIWRNSCRLEQDVESLKKRRKY